MPRPTCAKSSALAHQYEIPLASHDDTTEENVADAIQDRVSVAEFPTTMEAARGLHQAGIGILMGAPNVVRGGSHSGNIAAVDLAREGLSGYPVVRLYPLEPADGRAAIAAACSGDRSGLRRPHRHQDAGRSRGPCGPWRDRGRQARRSDPGACRARHSGGAQRLAGRAAGGMTETLTTATADQTAAIGPGRLVLVVGPSGAGKDTLLGLARAACADDRNVVFPRRVITREASASEENEEVSIGTFQEALARGEYAMHWEAHGHRYALPRAIDDEIRAGRTIVANVIAHGDWRHAPRLCRRRRWFRSRRRQTFWQSGLRCAHEAATAWSKTACAARWRTLGRAGRDHRQHRQRRIPRSSTRPHHQGREMGRVRRGTRNDRCRDHRAARGHLRLSQRCLDRQGRGPGDAGLSGADGQIAVRGRWRPAGRKGWTARRAATCRASSASTTRRR